MILVTGCSGFIGSHVCVELLKEGYDVIGIDNFCNSSEIVITKIKEIMVLQSSKDNKKSLPQFIFHNVDLLNMDKSIFKLNNISHVIHLAGLKAVGESVENPLLYYNDNLRMTLNLLQIMNGVNCKNIIFSSSATIYGNQKSPVNEDMMIGVNITNPYGQTKYMIERILHDLHNSDKKWNITCLRYFNPIGAHPSGLIGENPKGKPNNLMPYLIKVAVDSKTLDIFGGDYDTKDGTCIRDFIHVVDLAKGHIASLKLTGYNTFNLGTGKGVSVLELITTFERVNKIKINYRITNKRPGDLPILFSDPKKANDLIDWKSELSIEDMCVDSWRYSCNNKFSYLSTNSW